MVRGTPCTTGKSPFRSSHQSGGVNSIAILSRNRNAMPAKLLPPPVRVASLEENLDLPLCQVDDPHKNFYFIGGLLLGIDIVAIASKRFVAESDENLSDSFNIFDPNITRTVGSLH